MPHTNAASNLSSPAGKPKSVRKPEFSGSNRFPSWTQNWFPDQTLVLFFYHINNICTETSLYRKSSLDWKQAYKETLNMLCYNLKAYQQKIQVFHLSAVHRERRFSWRFGEGRHQETFGKIWLDNLAVLFSVRLVSINTKEIILNLVLKKFKSGNLIFLNNWLILKWRKMETKRTKFLKLYLLVRKKTKWLGRKKLVESSSELYTLPLESGGNFSKPSPWNLKKRCISVR